MSDLLNKLTELVGDEEKAKLVQSALGEFMIPKTEYAKKNEQLKAKDSELEALRLASMSETEKLQHKLAEAEALRNEYGKKSNRLDAEQLFVRAGLNKDTYEPLLDKVVSEDKEKTISLVNDFVGILSKERESITNKTKEDLINSTKKPEGGTSPEGKSIQPLKTRL
jgi:predicted DNA-binding protein (UPF0251 family)